MRAAEQVLRGSELPAVRPLELAQQPVRRISRTDHDGAEAPVVSVAAAVDVQQGSDLLQLQPGEVLASVAAPTAHGWCLGFQLVEPERYAWFSHHLAPPCSTPER